MARKSLKDLTEVNERAWEIRRKCEPGCRAVKKKGINTYSRSKQPAEEQVIQIEKLGTGRNGGVFVFATNGRIFETTLKLLGKVEPGQIVRMVPTSGESGAGRWPWQPLPMDGSVKPAKNRLDYLVEDIANLTNVPAAELMDYIKSWEVV